MKLLNFDKVICLSPHPDDVEYSMLGTILKYTDTQFNLIQLAQGGECDNTTNISRLEEVKNVWKKSECKNINIITTPYKFIKELQEEYWINFIEKYLNNIDAIF